MDTKQFLEMILPSRGVIFVQRIKPRPGHPKGDATVLYPVADADDAADKALELDRADNSNIYFAMATYSEVQTRTTPTGFTYAVGRTQDNAHQVRCLWQDIDVKPDKPGVYQTRDEAKAGLKQYLQAVGLPVPLTVSSGYGYHCYWLFDEAIAADEWEAIAKYQRAAWKHLGVKFDSAADQDVARVLRVPGTFNKKPGKEPQPVRVISQNPPTLLPAMEYKRRLKRYCLEHNLLDQIQPNIPAQQRPTGTGNLTGLLPEYPDSFAAIAVRHCHQLQNFSQTGGASEPLWYANLGVLKHCKDGEHYAHLWSSEHEDYDRADTQNKLDQWSAGPTTCERFRTLDETGCAGCKHTCRSPVQLGQDATVEPPPPPAPPPPSGENDQSSSTEATPVEPAADTLHTCWPSAYGFGFNQATETITRKVEEDGVWKTVNVAHPLFYPINGIRLEDGTYALQCVQRVRVADTTQQFEFQLPLKVAADPRALKSALGAQRMTIMNEKHIYDFVQQAAANLRRAKDAIQTYQQMGWHHEFSGFLIGNTMITKDGERKVMMGKRLHGKELATVCGTSGSAAEWAQGVDDLYNRPHAEPHQLAIGNAFGSILNPLMYYSEWKGIPYALTSGGSGYGKSTAFKIGNSIYCKQTEKVVVTNSTVRAIPVRASQMNNLPFLLDEVTLYLTDAKDLSDTLYALSNGGTRIGCDISGSERDRPPAWNGSPGMTGNKGIIHHLTESPTNPEATQMRVFEVDLDNYQRMDTMVEGTVAYKQHNARHKHLAQHLLENCYGTVGKEWIRFVIANRKTIEEKLHSVSLKMSRFMEGGDSTKERYYYHWATCTLVGLYFAKKLGFVNFDLNNLRDWIVRHVASMRENVKEYRDTTEEHFATMMSSMVGRIIITQGFDNLDTRTNKIQIPLDPKPIRNPIAGRLVLGDDKERPKLYVTTKAVTQWCHESGVNYTTFRRSALEKGIIRLGTPGVVRTTGAVKVAIGRGVPGYTHLGSPTCFEFDSELASRIIPVPDRHDHDHDIIHLNRAHA